jgi:hypothetical protein
MAVVCTLVEGQDMIYVEIKLIRDDGTVIHALHGDATNRQEFSTGLIGPIWDNRGYRISGYIFQPIVLEDKRTIKGTS